MANNESQSTLPPYVVKGQWIDPDPDPISGPRQHPYGLAAYQIGNVETGEVRIYPSRAAAMGWVLS